MSKLTRRGMLFFAGAMLIAPPVSSDPSAKDDIKLRRLGILSNGSRTDPARLAVVAAFLSGLRDLGYSEGQNIAIEYRWADGIDEKLPTLARDILSANPEIILAEGPNAVAHALASATKTVPVVFVTSDPVTSVVGLYFTLYISLPFTVWAYNLLEPVIGRTTNSSVHTSKPIDAPQEDEVPQLSKVGYLLAWVTERDDPAAAQRVALHIIHNVEVLLANRPEMGRPGRVPGTRELAIPRTRSLYPIVWMAARSRCCGSSTARAAGPRAVEASSDSRLRNDLWCADYEGESSRQQALVLSANCHRPRLTLSVAVRSAGNNPRIHCPQPLNSCLPSAGCRLPSAPTTASLRVTGDRPTKRLARSSWQ